MKLTEAYDSERLAEIEKLYMEAFPAAERKPFRLILEKRMQGVVEIQSIEGERGEFYGLAITILCRDMVLLDYFAILPRQRGNGIGTEAFLLLRRKYAGRRFFLEIEQTGIEAENAVQRQRRKEFYLKNGMKETSLFVVLFGVDMEVMTDSCRISHEEYLSLYTETFGETRMGKGIKLKVVGASHADNVNCEAAADVSLTDANMQGTRINRKSQICRSGVGNPINMK